MQYRQIYNLKRFRKAGIILLPFLICFFGVAHAQEPLKKESRKKIIRQIKKEKEAYYSDTVFNCSVQELKEGIQKYFANKKGFTFRYEAYNMFCYTSSYSRYISEETVCFYGGILPPNPNSPRICRSSQLEVNPYVLHINIISLGDSTFQVSVDERTDYIFDLASSERNSVSFKYSDLIEFLNVSVKQKWKPCRPK